MLPSSRHRWRSGVEAQHLGAGSILNEVDVGNPYKEEPEPVEAREIGGGLDARKESCDDRRQRRVAEVVEELVVVTWVAGIEQVLILQTNDHLVDQWHSQARDLDEVARLRGWLAEGRVVAQLAGARQEGGGPSANDVATVTETVCRNL